MFIYSNTQLPNYCVDVLLDRQPKWQSSSQNDAWIYHRRVGQMFFPDLILMQRITRQTMCGPCKNDKTCVKLTWWQRSRDKKYRYVLGLERGPSPRERLSELFESAKPFVQLSSGCSATLPLVLKYQDCCHPQFRIRYIRRHFRS